MSGIAVVRCELMGMLCKQNAGGEGPKGLDFFIFYLFLYIYIYFFLKQQRGVRDSKTAIESFSNCRGNSEIFTSKTQNFSSNV